MEITEQGVPQLEIKAIPWCNRHLMEDCFLQYMTEEPLLATVGFDIVNDRDKLTTIFRDGMFRDDSPQMALWDKEKDKVVGILLSLMKYRDFSPKRSGRDYSVMSQEIQDRIAPIQNFFHGIIATYSNPENFGTDKVILLNALYIDKDYRRHGYASKLFSAALEKCRAETDVDVYLSAISSPYTMKAVERLGFKSIFTKEYAGNLVGAFDRLPEDVKLTHNCMHLVCKRFDEN